MCLRCIYEYHYEYTNVFEYINTSVVTRHNPSDYEYPSIAVLPLHNYHIYYNHVPHKAVLYIIQT